MNFLKRKLKKAQQTLTPVFSKTAFFMQGQMDIHPESRWHNTDFTDETGGFFSEDDDVERRINDLEAWDNTRRDMIALLLRDVCEQGIAGDFAELGVYKGHTARLIHHYAPERVLHLFDTFEGFPERSMQADAEQAGNPISKKLFTDTSLEQVQAFIAPSNDNVFFYKGYFPESIPEDFGARRFAFVHLDADLYEPTLAGLNYFYERMHKGGLLLVHDYNAWIGARKAVNEFFASKKEIPIPMPDKSGSALIRKL
jgi:O-methyltransferase